MDHATAPLALDPGAQRILSVTCSPVTASNTTGNANPFVPVAGRAMQSVSCPGEPRTSVPPVIPGPSGAHVRGPENCLGLTVSTCADVEAFGIFNLMALIPL